MSRATDQYHQLSTVMAKVTRGEALSPAERQELRDLARTFNETPGATTEQARDALIDETLEEALDALRVRVRWYETRRHAVPRRTARAFNRLADALDKPNSGVWRRV